MIMHLFKIVWNRKRMNALILAEIFLSFVVLFGLFTSAVWYYNNYTKPLGFEYENIWNLRINPPSSAYDKENEEETFNTIDQIKLYLQGQDRVKQVSMADITPYRGWSWNDYTLYGERKILTQMFHVDEDFPTTMGMELLKGRWLEAGDTAQHWTPVIINQKIEEELFKGEDPLGKTLKQGDGLELRVVGVFTDYRKDGELEMMDTIMMMPLKHGEDKIFPGSVVMKMQPGTPISFEEDVMKNLEGIAQGWSFTVKPLELMRKSYLREKLAPVTVMWVVAFFMLAMVAMGLIGVLWQNVTRRTSEMGVRRAKGATRERIYKQILGEFLILATIAVLLGLLLAVQIPIFGLFGGVETSTLVGGFLCAMVVIYLLTTTSALYPSWLATTVNPAEALHYE